MTGRGAALPDVVAVIGGGRMGSGITHAFLLAGCSVVLVESDAQSADAAAARVIAALSESADRAGDDRLLAAAGRLRIVGSAGEVGGAGLVVEAVPEDLELKAEVLRAAAGVVPADAVLATNTSSLSVTALAGRLPGPERVLGMHFFNPVPASALIEIVVTAQTDEAVTAHAREWVAGLGKTAITVTDSPGFASSRLGLVSGLEAIRMLQEGVASAEDIDTAMVLGYRYPVGPLRLTDMVGLDVRLAIAEHLERELGARFSVPQLLRDKVAAGELGRKSGRGFYDW